MSESPWYLLYAKTGREFEAEDEIRDLELNVWCGHKIEFKRRGKQRRAEPVEYPYLQNYIFAQIPSQRLFEVTGVRPLAKTFTPLCAADVRSLSVFQAEVEVEYANAQRISKNQEAICEYRAGQALRSIDPRFANTLLTFRGMVQRSHDLYPRVVAEMEMFGRIVRAELDPLYVRDATY